MYKKENSTQMTLEGFYAPFAEKLSTDNRWVKLSDKMPWDIIEAEYLKNIQPALRLNISKTFSLRKADLPSHPESLSARVLFATPKISQTSVPYWQLPRIRICSTFWV